MTRTNTVETQGKPWRVRRGEFPLLLFVIVAIGAFVQLQSTRRAADWVLHSETSLSHCADVERKIRGVQGAILSGLLGQDAHAAEVGARRDAFDALDALEKQVADNASQREQVTAARSKFTAWLSFVDTDRAGTQIGLVRRMDVLMAPVLEMIESIEREERRLRAHRIEALAESRNITFFVALPSLLVLAALAAFMSRRYTASLKADFLQAFEGQQKAQTALNQDSWVRDQLARLIGATRDEPTFNELGERFLVQLCADTKAAVGAFYVFDHEIQHWRLHAALGLPHGRRESFLKGESLVGRAGEGTAVVHATELSEDFLVLESGLGRASVKEVVLIPCHHDGRALGVIELGFTQQLSAQAEQLTSRVGEATGLALAITRKRIAQSELLDALRRQAEVLQSQQEELRFANEELATQSEELLSTQAQLEERKEELEATNENLTQQRDALARARETLAARAVELKQANRYKSEFLASMSHELRTPLNGCLILSKSLAENLSGNLNAEEVRFAETIYSSGKDLLELINAVLELSKIEAGGVQLEVKEATIDAIVRPVLRITQPLVSDRGLRFELELGDVSKSMITDPSRVQQILKNLLSNACKFTERGFVKLEVVWHPERVEFVVSDSGIGIAPEHQSTIFDAFQQADGTTSRRFGGTGLGLTISRDLAHRLGGDVTVHSEPGNGSRFTLALPVSIATSDVAPSNSGELIPVAPPPKSSDHATNQPPRSILLVEAKQALRKSLASIARRWGFSLASSTPARAIDQVRSLHPVAVVVDGTLSDSERRLLVEQLRAGPAKDVPVHVVQPETSYSGGDTSAGTTPILRDVDLSTLQVALREMLGEAGSRVLLIEDDAVHRTALQDLLVSRGFAVAAVGSANEAIAALSSETFACIVLDLRLPDLSGVELLKTLSANETFVLPHVIVYTAASLHPETERELRRYSETIIIKGGSAESRLVDELSVFVERLNSISRKPSSSVVRDRGLEGRTVLLAEDDVRNVYALTSVLERQGIRLVVARNGAEALSALDEHPEVDAVLMDIMMPIMNGLDAIRAIRASDRDYQDIPILALTAKAMREDKETCIAAGANEFMAKPLDTEQLVAMLKIWIRPK